MKFLGKMCLKIILKFTKNKDFTLSLEDTFLEISQGEGGMAGGQIDPPDLLGLNDSLVTVLANVSVSSMLLQTRHLNSSHLLEPLFFSKRKSLIRTKCYLVSLHCDRKPLVKE